MNTAFGKFVSGKFFDKLFLLFLLAGTVFMACAKGSAVRVLTDSPWLSGAVCVFYLAAGILITGQRKISAKMADRNVDLLLGFATCFFIYDFFFLLIWEILTGLFHAARSVRAAGAAGTALLSIVVVAWGYLHAKNIKSISYSLDLGLGNKDYHILLISDIHLGAFVRKEQVRRIVDKINTLAPDLVLIAGDIIDVDHRILSDGHALAEISREFRKIQAKDGVFAVLGNHDPNIEDQRFTNFLRHSQICLLHNKVIRILGLNIVGRTDSRSNYRVPLKELLKQTDPSRPLILLDHDSQGIPEAVRFGADLVLCGHTHKGQFFPVTLFTKWANGRHYFYGHETFGKTHAIISSGAGFFQLPVRIGTNSEVADIHLF